MKISKNIHIKKILILTGIVSAFASRAFATPWVAGYYAGWEESHLPITSVDMTSMDALIHFAVVPNSDASLNASINGLDATSIANVVSTVHAAGKKVLFTVGGAGSQAGFEGAMSSTYLTTFVNNIANFMTSNNYDGVDIDMEMMNSSDVAPYVAFIKALRAKMTAVKPGSLLTAAVTWEPSAFAQLTGVFDHIDLMTYSLTGGTWYNETWHDAPVYSAPAIGGGTLTSLDSMVKQFAAAGVPAADLGIGITFDPYIWTGGSGVTKPQQTWTSAPSVNESYYYTIAQTYGLVEGSTSSVAGSVYGWDSSAQASYLSVTGNPASSDAFISYDDVSAINAKFAYAKTNGIGSMIIWDLAAGWRTDLPSGQQGLLLEAVKSATYGGGSPPVQAAPVISGVSASNIGQVSASVSWITNEGANTQVEYGLTSSYGATTALNTSTVTSHSAVLDGLSAGTVYHYAVESQDSAGNLTISSDSTFTTITAPPVETSPFSDNFSSYTLNTCFSDGSTFGRWQSAFSGYGCNSIETDGVNFWLNDIPAVSTSAAQTHSSLVIGPSFAAPITFSVNVNTNAQLRQNTPPNPWEVAWVLWDYTSNSNFYYFQAKPNGWELGKEDPAYPGNQRFLATGSSPVFPIGAWYQVKIVQIQNVITVYVNGQLITTFTDTENPYTSGNIALYNEDSDARFQNIEVNQVAPIISSISTYGIGQSSAAVSWVTNEAADTQVEYGLTSSYGLTTTLSTSPVTSHNTVLDGLSAGTLYHYAVESRDSSGQLSVSSDSAFTTVTAPPVQAAPVISSISTYGIGQSSAVVSWVTNEAADTQVEYGLTSSYGLTTTLSTSPVTSHNAILTGLAAGTLYHYAVESRDSSGQLSVSSDSTLTTATAPPVQAAPVISGVSASNIGQVSASVSWITNEAANTQVEYGLTSSYGTTTVLNTSTVTSHSAVLDGLSAGTLYHYAVESRDSSGQLSVSSDSTLTTATAPPVQSAPVISSISTYGIGQSSAAVSWITNEAADTQVEYGLTSSYGLTTTLSTSPVISHNAVLDGLSAGTLYHYAVESRSVSGDLSISTDSTFSTAVFGVTIGTTPPTVAISAPVAGATVSGVTRIFASAYDNVGISSVQFKMDGENLGPTITAAPYMYSWNTALVANGAHTLSTIAWNFSGTSSTTTNVSVFVSNAVGSNFSSSDQARAPQKFLSPALADGINDVAVFGPAAANVSIYNIRGREVFHSSQQGGSSIIWNCRDGSGHIQESGVYIAKIQTVGSGTLYQSFAIVK